MKAYFLVNFARFVEWPEEGEAGGVMTIGVLGRDPFGPALDAYTGQLVKGRKIVVRRAKDLKELPECRVLYFGLAGEDLLKELRTLKGRSVLTFGESEEFIQGGGVVRFTMEDKKVHMQVSRRAYTEARLKISSHLLAITSVVN